MTVGSPAAMHQRLPARPRSVPLLRHAVDEFAAACGASARQRAAIALAVSEAITNAVVHAYIGHEVLGDIELHAQMHEQTLQITVSDEGVGMRPRLDSPGVGVGLGLIASVTDDFELAELDPGVRLRMTFAIS